MSLEIKSNLKSINAHRKNGLNNVKVSESIEKLSSKYEINRVSCIEKMLISVVFISEPKELKSLLVAIVSMLENERDTTKYEIIILSETGYNYENEKLFLNLEKKYDCKITNIKSEVISKDNCEKISKQIAINLNDIDRCIYLDYNVIVQRDLTELYNFDLGEQSIGGVMDIEFNKLSFSVMIIDCAKIRELNMCEVKQIDLKFNLRAKYFQDENSFDFGKNVIVAEDLIKSFEKKQLREAFKENVIFSYTNEVNPIVSQSCSFTEEWLSYYLKSPLFDAKQLYKDYNKLKLDHENLKNEYNNLLL